MPLSPLLASRLREESHDAIHASDVALDGASDDEIIAFARRERRVVVTADLDYPRILALLGLSKPGVILFRGGNYGEQETAQLLERVLKTISLEELSTSIVVVDKKRIRKRRLPVF